MKKHITNFIAVFLALVITFNLVACSSKKDDKDTEDITIELVGTGDADSPYASDALKTITINDLNVNEINVVSIDPKDVVVKGINVEEIKSIELQVVPLNDEMVTLAYENFKSVYEEDIDVGKLIANVAVGTVCVVVYVVLRVYGGPLADFFGIVMADQFTALSIVLGAAIDAAISGFQAYQEGGDASYIIGHMVNGVAEGFMWFALLAPLTTAVDMGISGFRALKVLRKLPDFANLSDKEAVKILKNLPKLIKESIGLVDNAGDDVIKAFYRKLPQEFRDEIAEDVYISMFRNKETLISIVHKYNPFNLQVKVNEALRDNFWSNLDDVSDDVIKDIIKKLQSGKIRSFDDINNPVIETYIRENQFAFINSHADKLTSEFVENWLKEDIGDSAYKIIKDNIINNKGMIKIAEELGYDSFDNIITNPGQRKLLAARFGSDSVKKLSDIDELYKIIYNKTKSESDDFVFEIINKLFDGTLDIDKISDAQVVNNLVNGFDSVSAILDNLGLKRQNKDFLIDLAARPFVEDGISNDVMTEILSSGMGKESIISKYGERVWQRIAETDYYSIARISSIVNNDSVLIRDIVQDSLMRKGYSDQIISSILRGDSCSVWGISDKEILELAPLVSEFYRSKDKSVYKNFVFEYSELRGKNIEDFLTKYKQNNTIRNSKYAGGVMVPAGKNADYVLDKYGQIQMSTYGFPIFDEFAIARVEIEGLTGAESDIDLANIAHHGTKDAIPGYTWHHLEDGKTLILIPTELHDAYRHTGGADLISEGLLA